MKTIPHSSRAQGKSCAQLIDLAWSERSREGVIEMLNMAIKGIFASTDKNDRDIMIIIDYDDADSTSTTIMEYIVDEHRTNHIPIGCIGEPEQYEYEFEVDQLTKQKYPPRSFSNRGKGKRKQW